VKGEKGIGGDSDVDLVAVNLHPDRINPPKNFILKTDDLKGIEYAAIEVKGWHTEAFTPSLIKAAPRIFNFIRPEADKKIKDVIQTAHYKKILVIPTLTKNEEKRKEATVERKQDSKLLKFTKRLQMQEMILFISSQLNLFKRINLLQLKN